MAPFHSHYNSAVALRPSPCLSSDAYRLPIFYIIVFGLSVTTVIHDPQSQINSVPRLPPTGGPSRQVGV